MAEPLLHFWKNLQPPSRKNLLQVNHSAYKFFSGMSRIAVGRGPFPIAEIEHQTVNNQLVESQQKNLSNT